MLLPDPALRLFSLLWCNGTTCPRLAGSLLATLRILFPLPGLHICKLRSGRVCSDSVKVARQWNGATSIMSCIHTTQSLEKGLPGSADTRARILRSAGGKGSQFVIAGKWVARLTRGVAKMNLGRGGGLEKGGGARRHMQTMGP